MKSISEVAISHHYLLTVGIKLLRRHEIHQIIAKTWNSFASSPVFYFVQQLLLYLWLRRPRWFQRKKKLQLLILHATLNSMHISFWFYFKSHSFIFKNLLHISHCGSFWLPNPYLSCDLNPAPDGSTYLITWIKSK